MRCISQSRCFDEFIRNERRPQPRPFAELAGHPLADAKGIPSLGVRLQPLSAPAAHPPAVLGGWSAGALGNRLVADTGARLVDWLYGGVVAGFRRDLGLPKASARELRRRRTDALIRDRNGASFVLSRSSSDGGAFSLASSPPSYGGSGVG